MFSCKWGKLFHLLTGATKYGWIWLIFGKFFEHEYVVNHKHVINRMIVVGLCVIKNYQLSRFDKTNYFKMDMDMVGVYVWILLVYFAKKEKNKTKTKPINQNQSINQIKSNQINQSINSYSSFQALARHPMKPNMWSTQRTIRDFTILRDYCLSFCTKLLNEISQHAS